MSKLYSEPFVKKELSTQDLISQDKNKIIEKLKGYELIEGQDLNNISLGSWIKYISNTGLFRSGGVLTANGFPDYLVLKNPTLNKSWSVNLRKNNIYVSRKKDEDSDKREKEVLYKLYKQGLLEIIEK